jgi:PspA-Associated protein
VIVRISTEGQYKLTDSDAEALNELDNKAAAACDAGDPEQFRETFEELIDFVRTNGQSVPEWLGPSDVTIPPPDVSLEEARKDFSGEGLIPG